jgi:hypothetical protein
LKIVLLYALYYGNRFYFEIIFKKIDIKSIRFEKCIYGGIIYDICQFLLDIGIEKYFNMMIDKNNMFSMDNEKIWLDIIKNSKLLNKNNVHQICIFLNKKNYLKLIMELNYILNIDLYPNIINHFYILDEKFFINKQKDVVISLFLNSVTNLKFNHIQYLDLNNYFEKFIDSNDYINYKNIFLLKYYKSIKIIDFLKNKGINFENIEYFYSYTYMLHKNIYSIIRYFLRNIFSDFFIDTNKCCKNNNQIIKLVKKHNKKLSKLKL